LQILWSKDGVPVSGTDRAQMTYRSGIASLEIFSSRLDDAGTYTCRATNELGSDETTAAIQVQSKDAGPGYHVPRVTSPGSAALRFAVKKLMF
jgi:hypothetical protein